MPKNGSNDLKFRHKMYCNDSNQILKLCQSLPKYVDFLAENQSFLKKSPRFSVRHFKREIHAFLGK